MRFIPIFLLGIFGSLLIFLQIERFGPFISTDGVKYLQLAENLREGLGFCIKDAEGCKFESHWAPGFPVLLSLFPNYTLLILLLSFLTVFLLWFVLFDITHSTFLAFLFTITFTLSPTFLKNFSFLFSETLYIPILLLTLIFLKEYLKRRDSRILLAFSFLVGLGNLVRYANLFSVGVILLILLIYRTRFKDILIFLLFSLIPFFTWQLFSTLQGKSVREFVTHFPSDLHYQILWNTLKGYVFPNYADSLNTVVFLLISAFLIYAVFKERRSIILVLGLVLVKLIKTHIYYEIFILFSSLALFLLFIYRELEIWGKILTWFMLGYLIFLFLSVSFFDFYTLPDIRIMSPFFVILLLMLSLTRSKFLPLPFLLSYSNFAIDFVKYMRLNGDGLNTPYWANLKILEEVRKLPKDAYVYSNVPEILYLHAGIYASFLPKVFNPNSNVENKNFTKELREMSEKLRKRDGFLVIIRPFKRNYLPSEEFLKKTLSLQIYAETRDGAIYKR